MTRPSTMVAAILAVALYWAPDARAAEITLTNTFSNHPGVACSASTTETNVAATTPLETPCSTAVFTGSAKAKGSFIGSNLSLGTFATLTIDNRSEDPKSATAEAIFKDTVVPTFSGFASFSWEVEGSASCSVACNFFNGPWAGLELQGNGNWFFSFFPSGGALAPTLATFSVPVTTGVPVDLTVRMLAQAWIENSFAGSRATADFFNTATLLNVAFLDPNSQPIAGGSLVSNAGLTYPTVPEPSTLVLLGTGAAGILGRARRRIVSTRAT